MRSAGVIFDVDGVLVDSYRAHFASWQGLARQHELAVTQPQFAATFGRTSREAIIQLWPDRNLSPAQIAAMDDQKEALFRAELDDHFPAMDGAAELIVSLAEAGFALAVGSSGPPENVELVLRQVDPRSLITARVTGADVTRGKPDPQVFQLAAERLGLPPHACVVIEDAAAGVAAAHAAGMPCIGLVSTGRTRAELQGAELVVDCLRELTPRRIADLRFRAG